MKIVKPKTDRVLRGGSWLSLPWIVRSADRNFNTTPLRYSFIGFRLVKLNKGKNYESKINSKN